MPSIPSDDSIDSKLTLADDGRCNSFQGTFGSLTCQVSVCVAVSRVRLSRLPSWFQGCLARVKGVLSVFVCGHRSNAKCGLA